MGRSLMSHPFKEMDKGHHARLTFNHLAFMRGGFPISNGNHWKNGKYPAWAKWTGDPTHDNYAHRAPGQTHRYHSNCDPLRQQQRQQYVGPEPLPKQTVPCRTEHHAALRSRCSTDRNPDNDQAIWDFGNHIADSYRWFSASHPSPQEGRGINEPKSIIGCLRADFREFENE